MGNKDETFESLSKELMQNHLELTALIQDIYQCVGPLEYLNQLNAVGREKIVQFRINIEHLTDFADRERDRRKKNEYLQEIDNYKGQLSTIMTAFRKANIASVCTVEKRSRDELLYSPTEKQNLRKRKDKSNAIKSSNQLTDRLLDISKHLAETSQRSGETLGTLIESSDKVSGTHKELEHQQQVIVQSGKLLGKYGRREITDKAILVLAFVFFLAVVFYIIQKRLF